MIYSGNFPVARINGFDFLCPVPATQMTFEFYLLYALRMLCEPFHWVNVQFIFITDFFWFVPPKQGSGQIDHIRFRSSIISPASTIIPAW